MWRVKLESDSQAFAELMHRWQQPIQNLCARMVGDLHRAEDLAQGAFVRLYSARITWQPEGRFSTFLWRIALIVFIDDLRNNKRRGECSLDALNEDEPGLANLPMDTPGPDAQLEQRELADEVRQALLKLAPHYREVVVLRHYEHLKFHEIGEVLGIAEGTAKSRMFEAINQLTRLLKHLDDRDDKKSCNPNPKNQSHELLAL
jgi:RNA polymerase sigma-70 factor (ECF subfamily)